MLFIHNLYWDIVYPPFYNAPKQSGVYIACIKEKRKSTVLYIGTSKNLYNRIKSHEVHRRCVDDPSKVFFLTCTSTPYRFNTETNLIFKINPKFNSQTIKGLTNGIIKKKQVSFCPEISNLFVKKRNRNGNI